MTTHILGGISGIINPENVKPGVDAKNVEKQMIAGITQKPPDPCDVLGDTIRSQAMKLGINLDSVGLSKKRTTAPLRSPSPVKYKSPPPKARRSPPRELSPLVFTCSPRSSPRNSPARSPEPSPERGRQRNRTPSPVPSPTRERSPDYSNIPLRGGDDLKAITQEQFRKEHIDAVLGESTGKFTFEGEKTEDAKFTMLSAIDALISALNDEDIDISRIPKVNEHSTAKEIFDAHKALRYKYDRNQYSGFADEMILSGAYFLEELFDGKKMYFGYTPNLGGWSSVVQVKLRRNRVATSELVASFMRDNNIGPGMSLLLELLPSAFIYSNRKSQEAAMAGFSDDAMAGLGNDIANGLR